MDNLFNVLSGFSTGHEKALKQGIYNAVALFMLCLISAIGYGLYIVLSPFIKPLIWALLCGSVLFPFKYSLATTVQSWFNGIESNNKPLVINLSLVPLHIVDNFSETLGSFLWKHVRYIIAIFSTIISIFLIYYYTPNIIRCLIWKTLFVFDLTFNFFASTCNVLTISMIFVGYLTIVYTYWTPHKSSQFRYVSFAIWFTLSLYISNILGAYQVIIFVTLQLLSLLGFVYEVLLIVENQESKGRHLTFAEASQLALINQTLQESCSNDNLNSTEANEEKVEEALRNTEYMVKRLDKRSISLDSEESIPINNKSDASRISIRERYLLARLKYDWRMSLDVEDDKVDTDKYMYGAFYACVGMLLWKHRWIISLLVIPIAYYIIKQLGNYFGLWQNIYERCQTLIQIVEIWCSQRQEAILPPNVKGLYKIVIIFDKKITERLKGSVDAVATTAVILGLLIFTTCTSIFITIQIYAEGLHLVQVTGEILNSSLMNNPDIDWVPEQWEESVNSVLDNAYTYGRSALSDGVKNLVKDLEPIKADQMEKKVLELWDRLYQAWMMSNENPELIGPTVDATAAYSVWESFKDSFGKMPLQLFNMTNVQNFAKDNVGILMSVLDSIWSIVKGNMSVILSLFTEMFYIVLMSGTAVLNFTLSTIVFFTTLFYLLSSSDKTYKPIELTTVFSPISCHRFALALQEAVIGVFAATFKLASFFGMWTWFIHNLFQVKIVYLPSAFATILGALPFLDAYFACIPATFELWFTRGPFVAVLFFMFHFLPCNIVVTEFYKEIKGGGHPYLTGLSIAGGIFCLGVEGAIFGPLLLCCIMVVINLSRRYLHSPSDEVIKTYSNVSGEKHSIS